MSKKQKQQMWLYKPEPPKFAASEKERMLAKAKEIIARHPKVSQKVSRIDMRANRIYLYELVEQFKPEGAVFIKPLIDDKYLEFPYARLTILDTKGEKCTADFQRHNNQWVELYNGTLSECKSNIEDGDVWF